MKFTHTTTPERGLSPQFAPRRKMRLVHKLRRHPFWCGGVLLMILASSAAFAVDIATGKALYDQGQYKQSADYFKGLGDTPEALVWLGRSLDMYANQVNNDAEQACYRGKGSHTPQCMVGYANKMNALYGADAFKFIPTQIIIRYTGTHYQQVLDKYAGSPVAAEAAYYELEKNLIGSPDDVLKRVQDYIAKYKGPYNLKARLLFARLNEDLWWIHRKWAWMLYNGSLAEDELVVRGEKYRQAAIKAYEELIKKDGGTPEGKLAKQEVAALKNNQDDGKLYGIVSDAMTSGEAGFQHKQGK